MDDHRILAEPISTSWMAPEISRESVRTQRGSALRGGRDSSEVMSEEMSQIWL